MKCILSHLTAYRHLSDFAVKQTKNKFAAYWEPLRIEKYARVANLQDVTAQLGKLPNVDLGNLQVPLDKVDLLVVDPHNRSNAKGIVNHIDADFEPIYGSLIEAMPNVFVVSPELLFLQMASEFEKIDLIEFGFELCGGYSLSASHEYGFVNRFPLTSVKRIDAYLKRCKPSNAVHRATEALRHVADHSASPRETTFVMLASLPSRDGGFGLELPCMNYKIELDHADKWRRNNYYCDIFWPKHKLAVEYSGTLVHNKDNLFSDNERENIIELEKIRVIRIDAQQLSNYESLEIVLTRIAQYMGIKFRRPSPQTIQRRENLRSYLYGTKRAPR